MARMCRRRQALRSASADRGWLRRSNPNRRCIPDQRRTKKFDGFGRDEWQGRAAATSMANGENVISEYTDRQAVEDGVLVAVNGEGGVNRVTRAVFDHFTKSMGNSPITGPVTDIGPLMKAIRAMLEIQPDEDGWRTGEYQGQKL